MMKKSLFVTLVTCFSLFGFAQTNKSDSESDSLFKAYLAKNKGVKFEEQKTQKKDTVSVVSPVVIKKTNLSKNTAQDSLARVDSLNRVKAKSIVKRDTVAIAKKDTAIKAVRTPAVSPTPSKADAKQGLHKFKDYNNTYALEAERKGPVVKLYLKMDDIEQYAEIVLVRSQAELGNFTDVKHIPVIKGANKFEYVEAEDRYPLSTKVAAAYKIRAITKDGAIRMFPAITLEPGNK